MGRGFFWVCVVLHIQLIGYQTNKMTLNPSFFLNFLRNHYEIPTNSTIPAPKCVQTYKPTYLEFYSKLTKELCKLISLVICIKFYTSLCLRKSTKSV